MWWGRRIPRISEVIVFATTLECDGDSVKRMSCVDDSGEMVGDNGMNGIDIGTAYLCSVVGIPGSPWMVLFAYQ